MDSLILLAGGSGERAGEGPNKVYRRLDSAPLLSYSLQAIRAFNHPVRLLVVARKEDRPLLDQLLVSFGDLNPKVVLGGATRYQSEKAGLAAINFKDGELIGIHDGARPFLTADLWEACRAKAELVGGAIPVVDPGPTFRNTHGQLRELFGVVKAQTPQIFNAVQLVEAFAQSVQPGFDTAETVARSSGLTIGVVAGDHRNIKVTTASDFERAAALVGQWAPEGWLFP